MSLRRLRSTQCLGMAPFTRRFYHIERPWPLSSTSEQRTKNDPTVEIGYSDPHTRQYYVNQKTGSQYVGSSQTIFPGTERPMPMNVELTHYAPMKLIPTHGQRTCDLYLRAYTVDQIEFFAEFAMRAAFYLNMPVRGPVYVPKRTERWTIVKSPFAHAKTKVNFERVTHKRLIHVLDAHMDTIETWLGFLRKYELAGVAMKAHLYNYEAIDFELDEPDVVEQEAREEK
ncbi:ribosomal protein S10 domain-containing protein [Lipomyces kononenkoae]|uniref:Ribosomal protein S10 domain-containing protein n=1 Tax=Lipomyces kononenkoae TaxID=34357 RepID=A0ACC3SYH8_LIPKO